MTDPADLWDFDDPGASAARFRDAAVGADRPVMLTQVARALGLQEEYAELDAAGETDPYVDEELALLLDQRRDPPS